MNGWDQVKQVTVMLKHIIQDCDLFEDSPTVEKFKEAQFYQYQVDRLHKEINRPKMRDSLELNEFSSFLYSRASKIEHDLLKSDIFLSYTKLFIIHHLRDTTILEKEDWIMNLRHHQI